MEFLLQPLDLLGGDVSCHVRGQAIQKRQLPNGLPVWTVELHKVPVAQANLVVFGGSTEDPPGKFGVTSVTTMTRAAAGG